jgi:hypothetical protein
VDYGKLPGKVVAGLFRTPKQRDIAVKNFRNVADRKSKMRARSWVRHHRRTEADLSLAERSADAEIHLTLERKLPQRRGFDARPYDHAVAA